MNRLTCISTHAIAAACLTGSALASPPPQSAEDPEAHHDRGFEWDARAVEHVWNRAGFGIHSSEIDAWVEAGPVALVDHLLQQRPLADQSPIASYEYDGPRIDPVEYEQRTLEERRAYRAQARKQNRRSMEALRRTWVRQILAGDDPLRDRMTMFWHGVFTSSYRTVRHAQPIIAQHDTIRENALESYDALLRAMLRDVALLRYLDNDKNRKGNPNENLAREVMELFSLGEGNYTEADVREAARALTGAGIVDRFNGGSYRFTRRRHDRGIKTILGEEGRHGPQALATILLDQPACAEFIARSILEYFEGVSPEDERVAEYARQLRETEYDIGFFVRTMLLDPAFYSDDVIGARVASPIDYLAGTARRLDVVVPPEFVIAAARVIGQDLFEPPNVKGWDEGLAWITTSNFMMRGNIAGALLGVVDGRSMRADALAFARSLSEDSAADDASMEGEPMGAGAMSDEMRETSRAQLERDELIRLVRLLRGEKYGLDRSLLTRTLRGRGAKTDEEVVRTLAFDLLAVEPPAVTLRMLEDRLGALRDGADLPEFGHSSKGFEPVLRQLAHLVLSLPEAQIH